MRKASQKEVTLTLASEDQLNREEKEKTPKTGIGHCNKDVDLEKQKKSIEGAKLFSLFFLWVSHDDAEV